MSHAAEIINPNTDMGVGSQLIGNPQHGQWLQVPFMSFWEWYGMYSPFSNMFRGPVYYDRWSSHRGYSYYSDYGRSRYTVPYRQNVKMRFIKRQNSLIVLRTARLKALMLKSVLAQHLCRASRTPTKSTATRSSFASSSGSMRSGNSRTSRGFGRGGKRGGCLLHE